MRSYIPIKYEYLKFCCFMFQIPENVANTHNPEHPVAELPVSPPIKRRGNPSQQQFSSALAAASAIDSKQQRGPNYVQASSHAGAIQRTVGFAEPKSSPSGASASAEVKQTPAPPPPPTSSAPAAAASEQREKSKQKREPNPRKLKALLKSGLQITKHGRLHLSTSIYFYYDGRYLLEQLTLCCFHRPQWCAESQNVAVQ